MKKLIFLFLLIPIIASGQITSKILPSLKPPSERIALAYDANQPLNIDDECKVWLDGDDASTFTLNGTKVIQWDDKGALGADVSNDVDATRPTYDINTGRVTFTAANSTFLQSAAFASTLGQPITVFIVAKHSSYATSYTYLFASLSINKPLFNVNDLNKWQFFAGVPIVTSTQGNANDNIFTVLFNGVSSALYINGVLDVAGAIGTGVMDGLTLGINYVLSYPSNSEIGEVIIYNADISDVDRDKITGYLANKWGVY